MPTSTRVHESGLIPAPISTVWKHVRTLSFGWWSLVEKTTVDGLPDQVGSTHTIHYKDGSKWTVKLAELSDIETFLTYELISSVDPLPVSSAIHTIRLRRVTATNETFIEWTTDYSSDVTTEVTEDSRHKKIEAFTDLAKAVKAA